MLTNGERAPDGERLDSWKDVASYFGKSVSTVQRWEKHEGLPVRRHLHAKKGSIYAYRSEMDSWRTGRGRELFQAEDTPEPRAAQKRAWVRLVPLLMAAVLVSGVALGLYWRQSTREFEVVPFTSEIGAEYEADFSPDGSQVVYAGSVDPPGGRTGIFVRAVSGGQPRRVAVSPAYSASPKWSPDGASIAFVRSVSPEVRDVVVIPTGGGAERIVTQINGVSLTWARSGREIGVIDRESRADPLSVYVVTLDGGSRRRLTFPAAGTWGDIYAAFSPDGRHLAIARYKSFGNGDVYIVNAAGGEPRRLTFNEVWNYGFAWTPDSGRIVFSAVQDGGSSIKAIPWNGDSRKDLTVLGTGLPVSQYPALSRSLNGSVMQLVFQTDTTRSSIWKSELRDGALSARVITSTQGDEDPSFSRDGSRISFGSNRSGHHEVWVSDADGLSPVRLTSVTATFDSYARWSPDGRTLAYTSHSGGERSVFLLDFGGGPPRRLTNGRAEEGYPSWSADGRWIYFSSDRSGSPQIWKAPATGPGNAVQVTRGGATEAYESLDGALLYFVRGLDQPGLWSVPPNGGEEREVPDLTSIRMGYWGVANSGIAFIDIENRGLKNNQALLRMFRFADFKTHTYGTISAATRLFRGFSVSSDGRWVLWNQYDDRNRDLMLLTGFQ